MKRILASVIPAAALALVLGAPAFAQAAAAAPAAATAMPAVPKVGIVNIQSAIITSNEGQRDFGDLQKKFEPKRQELQTLSKDIDDLQKKFNAQADKLNDDARNELLKEIDVKKKQMQRSYEDANADMQAQQNEIANRIGQKMIDVLDKYAKEHDFVVVLDVSTQQSPVLWAAASVDITKPIIEAYNTASGVPAPPKTVGSVAPAAAPATAPKAKPTAAKR